MSMIFSQVREVKFPYCFCFLFDSMVLAIFQFHFVKQAWIDLLFVAVVDCCSRSYGCGCGCGSLLELRLWSAVVVYA